MNSQIVSINQALKSYQSFYFVTAFIAVSLFLSAGFISVSVIWFFALCLHNTVRLTDRQLNRFYSIFFIIILYVLNLPWLLFSDNQPATADLVIRKVHLLLIPLGFIMVNKRMSDRAFHFILTLFLVCCVAASFVCLVSAVIGFIDNNGSEIAGSYFTNSSLTAAVGMSPVYLSMFFNLAFLISLQNPFIGTKAKITIGIYLIFFIVLISYGAGIATMAIILIVWLLTRTYRASIRFAVAAVVFLTLSVLIYRYVSANGFESSHREVPGEMVDTIPARLAIWAYALKTASQKPFLGHGSGLGQPALEETYKKEGFLWGIRRSLNPHNQFLSTYLDLGIPGFFILVAVLLYPLVRSFKTNDFLLMAFIVMIFLFFCFESVLVRQRGIVFFSYFYCLIFSNRVGMRYSVPLAET